MGVEKANQGSGGFPGAGCRSKQCLNAVAEDSHNLTLKPSYIFHEWESLPDVKENQAALAKFEFLWQRNSSASFDVTQPPSRGDNFCKTFPFSTEIWVYKCCASLFLFV